jgi:hypothetical protein
VHHVADRVMKVTPQGTKLVVKVVVDNADTGGEVDAKQEAEAIDNHAIAHQKTNFESHSSPVILWNHGTNYFLGFFEDLLNNVYQVCDSNDVCRRMIVIHAQHDIHSKGIKVHDLTGVEHTLLVYSHR